MRPFPLLCSVCLVLSTGVSARGERGFPYHWEVPAGGMLARSGPGQKYYPTAELAAGVEVQVYRHAPGGWLAIRPPVGSFSWVRRGDLEATDQPNVARVRRDGAVCYVGSSLAEIQEHEVQVHLDRDERVRLLPDAAGDTASAQQLAARGWQRITPPAGEFRWIQASPRPVRRASAAADRAVEGRTVEHRERGEPAVRRSTAPAPRIPAERSVATAAASEPLDDGWTSRSRGGEVDELLEVERRLAEMASREPDTWRLAPLREQIEAAMASHGGPGRVRAEQLRERIAEFERLQHQYAAVGDGEWSAEGDHANQAANVSDSQAAARLRQRFDGSGWLVPVHSARRVAPPYALLDAQGEVVLYVSAAPGLNLHRYLRQEVGLHGQRSTPESLNKPHLTAERIVELRRHLP